MGGVAMMKPSASLDEEQDASPDLTDGSPRLDAERGTRAGIKSATGDAGGSSRAADPASSGRASAGGRGARVVVSVASALGVLLIAIVIGAAVLIHARLDRAIDASDAVTAAVADGRARMILVRQLEAARAIARQVRHAPIGPAGEQARRVSMVQAGVLLQDPVVREVMDSADREILTDAISDLETLAAMRARSGAQRGPSLGWRLALLALYAAPAEAPPDGSRGSYIRSLHTVLTLAAHADRPALSFLDHEAHRLADQAIAAPGEPLDDAARWEPGSVFAAIEAALSIPAVRAADLVATERADTLWARVDDRLARLGDHVLAEGDATFRGALVGYEDDLDRLGAGFVGVLLGALAALALTVAAVWWGALSPLLRLGRWATRLGGGAAGGVGAVAAVLTTMDDLRSRAAQADADAGRARGDAAVLRAALLGAAPEAALGRSLTTVADELQTMLGDIRAYATLARHECDSLVVTEGGPPRGRMPRPLPPQQDRAARLILDACASLREQCEFAAHMVGALRNLAGAGGPRSRTIDLTRTLEESLAVAAPRLRLLGATVRLSCNESVVVRGDPVALGAVVFYVVESALLRAEGGAAVPSRADPSDTYGDGGGAATDPGTGRAAMAEAPDQDQAALTLTGPGEGEGEDHRHPHAAKARVNGVSVATVLESGGRVRVTIADDGPAPGEAVRALMRDLDPSRPDGVDGGLAPALRQAPEVAALVLADALARAGLGCGLDVLAGEDWGLTVRLYLPLHAVDDER